MINVRANKACGRYSEAGIFGVFDFLSTEERHTQQQGTEQSCFCVVVVIIAVVLCIVVAECGSAKKETDPFWCERHEQNTQWIQVFVIMSLRAYMYQRTLHVLSKNQRQIRYFV